MCRNSAPPNLSGRVHSISLILKSTINRHFRSRCMVGAVSNCADAVRLETLVTIYRTAPTGVIARIFLFPVIDVC